MIWRTHLAIGLAMALLLLPYVAHKLFFIPLVLFFSLLPDIDTGASYLGNKKIFRPLQWFASHRGIIHSYSLCIIASLALAFFFPAFALPFFLGYSTHLVADSFTIEGIQPFWPFKAKISGIVTTSGKIEYTILFVACIADIILFIDLFV